jgi:hypothetical protein
MRRRIASWLNEEGRAADDKGKADRALRFYRIASRVDPTWSTPWYNQGLVEKYAGRWKESQAFNLQATALDRGNQGAWWNLGIAATALHDWQEARRAWRGFGVDIPDGTGEVTIMPSVACVRLNPRESGEVVWGERIDPARTVVQNIPLPESGRRFRDIVLNDGAPNGTRTWEGVE